MTAYQRRKREIAYLEQRGAELEAYLFAIVENAKKDGVKLRIPLHVGGGIGSDEIITDVNSGEFGMRLATAS